MAKKSAIKTFSWDMCFHGCCTVTALWFEDETQKFTIWNGRHAQGDRQKMLCEGHDSIANAHHTKFEWTHTLCLVSVNDCIALCIKPQSKPEFARRSTCFRVTRWSCGQLSLFGSSRPEPHIHQSAWVWLNRVDCFGEPKIIYIYKKIKLVHF